MNTINICSFNINGLRNKLHLLQHFNNYDIICLQETKITKGIAYLMRLKNYFDFHAICDIKKGYSGVSTYSKKIPKKIITLPWDQEGRVLILEYENIYIINVYYVNAGAKLERLNYKIIIWNNNFLQYIKSLKKEYIIMGDFNATVSNNIIDIHLHQPKVAGNTDIEVMTLQHFIKETHTIDIFRKLYPNVKKYTYWSSMTKARRHNKGWRIDYFLIHNNLLKFVYSTDILIDFMGSDHCPIILTINIAL